MSQEVDPTEFVQRIRQLGEQRDQQDAERVRKLEEEIIQGRSERLARRAERARSLSPDKPTTPQSLRGSSDTPRSVQEKAADTPTPTMEPTSNDSAREDSLQRLTGSPAQLLEDEGPKKPAPSAAALARSGTLSWQQRRPQSGSGRRPLSLSSGRPLSSASGSGAASPDKFPTTSPRDTPEPGSPAADSSLSRNQIAQSLGAKDPSWFKQTPDRGIGSAAYRRSQEDTVSEVGSVSGRRQLPGLSRESTAEPEATSPPPESLRSSSPSRGGSVRGSVAWSSRFSTNTSVSGGDVESGKGKSPLPVLDSQKFAPPSEQGSSVDGGDQTGSVRGLAMSPTQGRISPERPASPTKGMGGFVQSAMLKRSDSVSKRWSTQTPQGLTRQNSTLSNRGSAIAGYGSLSKADRPVTLSRDNSMEPSSRPGSSSSNLTITKDAADKDSTQKPEFVKPALPHHSRSKSVASTFSEDKNQDETTSPPSPSKRWSPTKSSWLENALNKPDSPKLKQPPPQQPSWMAELNRKKQQRGSVDIGSGSPIHSPAAESTPSGRSSPIKEVQLRPISLRRPESPKKEEPAAVEPSPKPKPVPSPKPTASVREQPKKESQAPDEHPKEVSPPTEEAPVQMEEPLVKEEPLKDELQAPTSSKSTTLPSRLATTSPAPSPATKPKPDTLPKKDLRSGLKSRAAMFETQPKKDDKVEFQNVFGKLKKTETKNYVAPDTFRENILRGKGGLAVTGGPQPSNRKDEFKESLISKKAAMLAKAQETGSAAHKKTDSSSSSPSITPEAIAKRQALGRSDSISNVPPPKEKSTEKQSTPEAIARKKSLRTSKPVFTENKEAPASPLAAKEAGKTNKLADRFNPALAGILARGPPASSKASPASESDSGPAMGRSNEEEKTGPAPELSHMTKGRARGPKRRAPAKQTTAEKENAAPKVANIATVPLVKTQDVLPSNVPPKTDAMPEESPIVRTPARESLKAKPMTPAKSPDLSRKMEKSPSPEVPRKSALIEVDRKASSEIITPKKSLEAQTQEPVKPVTSPKPATWRISKDLPTLPEKSQSGRDSVAGAQESLQRSAVATTEKHERNVPSPTQAGWRTSRPLPTPPPKTPAQSDNSSVLTEIPSPNREASPTKDDPSPTKLGFSVRGATALWGKQSPSTSPAPTKTKSPIKLPTKADEAAAMESAGLARSHPPAEKVESPPPRAPKPKPVGLGLGSLGGLGGFVAARAKSRESSPPKPVSGKALPISPPASGDRPQSEPFKTSPMPHRSDDLFADFFDEPPVTTDELPEHIDTIQILKTTPFDLGPGGKIRTLRKQIQEITGDGKLISIPMAEEHVLYQDSMYICTHVFGDSKGARNTEIYLWSGNGVAESTLEDVQLLGRNIAKQNQGKLVTLRQGNETPNFFEALGGIVITRRGSRPASKEYMLCGRRHLGHIAFDEVDFSLKSLCSGFAYIISTETGKVFLWKGRGCSAEELSAARLMGMDLAPTGDFNEIDEGSEPSNLFTVFPPTDPSSKAPPIPRSADHWRYKATSEKYRARLFKIEQQQGSSGWGQGLQVSSFFAPLLRRPSWQSFSSSNPAGMDAKTEQRPQTPVTPRSPLPAVTTKVVEVMPFCQRDLEPEHIYVLDAFFEMYIIVGALSRTQAAAFSTALMFAQEYNILAVSEEDRPFLPVTTIVLEGTPRDMKAVFRFWDDALIPAAGLMRGKLGRGKSLRIVGLEKAIEATRR